MPDELTVNAENALVALCSQPESEPLQLTLDCAYPTGPGEFEGIPTPGSVLLFCRTDDGRVVAVAVRFNGDDMGHLGAALLETAKGGEAAVN